MITAGNNIFININGKRVIAGRGSIFCDDLDSSAVQEFHYFLDGQLWVTFTSGARYIYKDVPLEIAMAVLCAESMGQAMNTIIKGGEYSYERYDRAI